MAYRVTWTPAAKSDLAQIAQYIGRDSRYYAASFVRSLLLTASSLGEMPLRGRRVPEFDQPNLREVLVGAYRLIFRVSEKRVEVLAVIHQARQLR